MSYDDNDFETKTDYRDRKVNNVPKSKIQQEIEKYFTDYHISKNVMEEAMGIAKQFSSKKFRDESKNLFKYYCLDTAHMNLGIEPDTDKLVELCNIKHSDIKKALKYGELRADKESSVMIHSPLDHIKSMCKKLQFEEHYNNIYELGKHIIETDETLNEDRPDTIAVGLISLYFQINNKDAQITPERIGLSPATVKNTFIRLKKVYDKYCKLNNKEPSSISSSPKSSSSNRSKKSDNSPKSESSQSSVESVNHEPEVKKRKYTKRKKVSESDKNSD